MMIVMVIVIVIIWWWWQWQLYCWQWSPWPWHLSPHMVQSLTPTSVGSLQTGIPHLASQVQTAASTLESSANLRSTRSYIQCHYQEKWTANNFHKVVDKRRSDRQAAQCAHVTVIYIYIFIHMKYVYLSIIYRVYIIIKQVTTIISQKGGTSYQESRATSKAT